jgi:hypothetical protein
MKLLPIVVAMAMLAVFVSVSLAQGLPPNEVFVSNITNQDLPVMLQGNNGKRTERIFAARKLVDIPCGAAALVVINNNGQADSWQLECGKRYALQITSDRTAFEVIEVHSRWSFYRLSSRWRCWRSLSP